MIQVRKKQNIALRERWKLKVIFLPLSSRAKLTYSNLHSVHPVPLLKFGRMAT
jgi:hypothetical protein